MDKMGFFLWAFWSWVFFLLKKIRLFGLYSFGENCGLQLITQLTLIGITYYYYFVDYFNNYKKKIMKNELVALLINKFAK